MGRSGTRDSRLSEWRGHRRQIWCRTFWKRRSDCVRWLMVRLRNEGHSRRISSRRICNAWSIWNTGEEFTRPYDVPLLDEFHGVRRATLRFEPRTDLCFFPWPRCPRKVPNLHLQREIRTHINDNEHGVQQLLMRFAIYCYDAKTFAGGVRCSLRNILW